MSSLASWGYSARTSSMVMPFAKKSRMSDTQMRVPRIQGLPKQTFGSTDMRLRSGVISSPPYLAKYYYSNLRTSMQYDCCFIHSMLQCVLFVGDNYRGCIDSKSCEFPFPRAT